LTRIAPPYGIPTRLRRGPGGFTMLELLMVMAIAGIMAVLAAPPLHDAYANNHVKVVAADLAQDMAFARANAIAYGKNVIVQPNTAGAWTSGWQIYVDNNTNFAYDVGEPVLRQATPTSGALLICTNVASFNTNVVFRPDGTVARNVLPYQAPAVAITPNDGITVSDTQGGTTQSAFKIRTLYIGTSGRVTNVLQNGGAPSTGVGGNPGGAC
jgi:type IV fimbrial biogenesis protein FimT